MSVQSSDKDITLFAKTNFRNREVPFGIRRDDRRRHMYIIGKTGMGKTTFIENMVVQDIVNGHGVCFVDPHGDSVEKILQFIPANRINDVVYLNPADMDFPIAFNPLEAVDSRHKHLVASGLMGVFTKIWAGVWSSRMEYILNNTILALLDSPGNTMLGIARMYVDKTYRKKIVDNIKDPVVKSFWVDEYANYQDKFRTEAVAPIQNKVGQFLSNSIIRNIVGQTKSSIDLRDIMDNRKILLLNLAKGRIGEDSSALLGAMVITKLQLAAMSRVDTPEEERADFYLYVDEFQNFATESFANILSEARKYRLNLIVAHQYIGQLVQDRNTVVRDAIFGNVGTMIAFRVGADDAEFLEKEFEPTYTMNDLVNLSKYSIYLKLMINGVASNPFSASTLPPISEPTGNIDKVIKVSRERYAVERLTVEQKIGKWLGAEFHTEAAKVESDSVNTEDAADELRFKHSPSSNTTVVTVPKAVVSRQEPVTSASQPVRSQPKQPSADPATSPVPKSTPEPAMEKPALQPKNESVHHKPDNNNRQREKSVHSGQTASDRRHQQDRRHRSEKVHPGQRSSDKPKHVKHQNPIWETVTQLTQEKLHESTVRTNQALKSIEKGLSHSAKEKSKTEHKPAVHTSPRSEKHDPAEKKNSHVHHKEPEQASETVPAPKPDLSFADQANHSGLGHLGDPELPQDHVHPEDHTLSPHINIQDTIARHSPLKPGDTVKFD
jgi:hypothetical protein